MDRLQLLETFVRVVNAGSFSAVARELRATQSAISKQVQALEAEVGARLLVRSTRSHSLTEAGKVYYDRCVQLLDALEEARIEVHRAEHEIGGTLRVAAPVAFGSRHIVPRLPAFYERYPRVKVQLQLDDGFVDLVAAGIDVAFRVGELKDSRLTARRIGTAQRAALAAPAYLERCGEPRHPADLARHNCLLYTGLVTADEWNFVDARGRAQTVRVAGNLESNSAEAIRQATCDGIGISYSTLWLYGDDLRAGRVKRILAPYHAVPLPLSAVFQPSRRPSPKIRSFVDHFADAFARDPDIAQAGGAPERAPGRPAGAPRQRPASA